jgi:hypothetical protein
VRRDFFKRDEFRGKGFAQNLHERGHYLMLLGRAEAAVQFDVAMFGDWDNNHPGLYGLGFEGFGVSVGTYLDINSIEAEVTINATEDTPAILGCLGGCEALFKVLDGDVRVEKASEGSIDKQPACDAELNVAEVLDTDPRGEAKRRNDQTLVVLRGND